MNYGYRYIHPTVGKGQFSLEVFRCLMRSSRTIITANKIAITIKDMVLVVSKKEVEGELLVVVEVGVEVDVEVGEDEEVGIGLDEELRGTFAGTETVCGLLQSLAVPEK